LFALYYQFAVIISLQVSFS